MFIKMTTDTGNSVRADKWLWAARFFKTRSLAMQAIQGGKVHVNGERVKPARRLVTGDRLTVQKGPYRYAITVERLSLQRRPAEETRALYSESDESVQERQDLSAELRLQGGHAPGRQERRPDKHARRRAREMKR
jgi:ribosome-associated heat shock protein Hsp15